mmetsp:Transcript_3669/g.10407  ORF Transcript_3669/g.10407 Transcript_3669/m.10407 type:complete len:188 (-) Transcript_3669:89-652(-)
MPVYSNCTGTMEQRVLKGYVMADPPIRPAIKYAYGKPQSHRQEISATAKHAMPGYQGHRPGNLKDRTSPASTCSEVSSISDLNIPVSVKAVQATPGYRGHIPGKDSNGVYGQTFNDATKTAVGEFREPGFQKTLFPRKGVVTMGAHIPGYAGHVGGKHHEDVVGISPQKAVKQGIITTNHDGGAGAR